MRYHELTELFDKKTKWHWSEMGSQCYEGSFDLHDSACDVRISTMGDDDGWEAVFAVDGQLSQTGEFTSSPGFVLALFSTVAEMVLDFMTHEKPKMLYFGADNHEASRVSLYARMAKQLAQATGYTLSIEKKKNYTYFHLNRAKQQVAELFNTSIKWRWTEMGQEMFQGNFNLNDSVCDVTISIVAEDTWEVAFDVDGDMGLTGKFKDNQGFVIAMFSTVADMVLNFMRYEKPGTLEFSADDSEPSRVRLYSRMAKQLAQATGYHVQETNRHSNTIFVLTKRKQQITELFNTQTSWTWSKDPTQWDGTFTVNGHRCDVVIGMVSRTPKEVWEVAFDVNGELQVTGEMLEEPGTVLALFSTVARMVLDFMQANKPQVIEFSSDNKEKSRLKLYARMVKQLGQATGYDVESVKKMGYTNFVLTKKEQITELFNNKVNWKWTYTGSEFYTGSFMLNDNSCRTNIALVVDEERKWEVTFDVNKRMSQTGEHLKDPGFVLALFATVSEMVLDFMKKEQPGSVMFAAANDEPSRVKLYARMSKQLAQATSYDLSDENTGRDTYFYLSNDE